MARTESGRILIVDDEPALLAVMEQYLSRLGYQVLACRSGRQAWQSFESQPSSYALVIADISMPDMSGQQLLLKMLDLNPGIGILLCSGYPFDLSILPASVRSRVSFLQKPFAPKMLAAAVEQLLSGRESPEPPS